MTVIYSAKVATANFSCFFKLLMRWRGSIYKILWKEFALFSFAHFALSCTYKFLLTESQKRNFEWGAKYCSQFNSLIPVAFVLGFYVNHVASRWWEKFRTLPWPGKMAMYVTAHLHGHDERARLMRRTIMRYMCLSYVITMASISPPVKKRFPNLNKMQEAGLMLPNEENVINNIKTPYNKFFVPLVWASAVVTRARKEGKIKDDFAVKTLIDEINDYRTRSFQLFNFDWVTIPLVYTQVVTLAVYTFFVSCLMGRQHLDNGESGEMVFPFFTFLQFLFYMGWLKVAETMLNPFGEDDDDFDINHLIDRNLKISYLVVDEMHNEHPDLIRDQYWDSMDFELPCNEGSEPPPNELLQGSTIDIDIPAKKTVLFPSSLSRIEEEGASRGFLVGSFNPKSILRTSSRLSNVSRASHSFKPHSMFRVFRRSFSQHRNSMTDEVFPVSEARNSVISLREKRNQFSPIEMHPINMPQDDQDEEGIFQLSLEDLSHPGVVEEAQLDRTAGREQVNLGRFSKSRPTLHGSPPKAKRGFIRRNNTDGDLEAEKGKDGHKTFSSKYSSNSTRHRSSINKSILEEEEYLSPGVNKAEKGMFVDDMMQSLKKLQKDDPGVQQASYSSQAEIMNLLRDNIKSGSPKK